MLNTKCRWVQKGRLLQQRYGSEGWNILWVRQHHSVREDVPGWFVQNISEIKLFCFSHFSGLELHISPPPRQQAPWEGVELLPQPRWGSWTLVWIDAASTSQSHLAVNWSLFFSFLFQVLHHRPREKVGALSRPYLPWRWSLSPQPPPTPSSPKINHLLI